MGLSCKTCLSSKITILLSYILSYIFLAMLFFCFVGVIPFFNDELSGQITRRIFKKRYSNNANRTVKNVKVAIGVEMKQPIHLETYEDTQKIVITNYHLTIRNSTIPKGGYTQKVTYSDFPDLGYVTLVGSLYLMEMPDYVFFVNASNVNYMPSTSWLEESIIKIQESDCDVLYGGETTYNNIPAGIGVALVRTPVIRELLYYTNVNVFEVPPLLALSLLNSANEEFRSIFYEFEGLKPLQNYDYVTNAQIPHYQTCPNLKDPKDPTIGVLLPQFKREYIYDFITSYEKQTILPEFYCLVQCENRVTFNIELIRSKSSRPVYHIWGYNWQLLFFYPLYISGLFPVDFVMRWDDDQMPDDVDIHKNFMNIIRDKNLIIGMAGLRDVRKSCGKWIGQIKHCKPLDHVAVPLMYRPYNARVAARLSPATFRYGEDVHLCISSKMVCDTISTRKIYATKQFQNDNKSNANDQELNKIKIDNEHNPMKHTYCHYRVHAGYVPVCFTNATHYTPKNSYMRIEYEHTQFYEM
ncbi:hypothetical protein GPJ56_005685 [Histomonas meleagridis]|uniref:uncharacterized protein n=1 Tax=Histomonas meleagridis TaxID=135588 RepID=UPI00355A33DA|nr:hypothetical protein GPJ56_005685 [Histomonas meleagridis]KAH0803380.1 hypothetical protein GO595_003724 [Histomonas meleagridis]